MKKNFLHLLLNKDPKELKELIIKQYVKHGNKYNLIKKMDSENIWETELIKVYEKYCLDCEDKNINYLLSKSLLKKELILFDLYETEDQNLILPEVKKKLENMNSSEKLDVHLIIKKIRNLKNEHKSIIQNIFKTIGQSTYKS